MHLKGENYEFLHMLLLNMLKLNEEQTEYTRLFHIYAEHHKKSGNKHLNKKKACLNKGYE